MTEMSNQLRKYFIMGSQNCTRDPVEILREAIQGGITAFQYREKGTGALTGKEKMELGIELRKICKDYGIPFFINDDLHLVEPLEVDGIHVGQEDAAIAEIRKLYPKIKVGLSISNQKELRQSPVHLVDYIGAGPMFPTKTKTDAKEAVGVKWMEMLREKYPLMPIVGIGGITPDNAQQVLQAGGDGVAVISTITKAKNIQEVVARL